MGGFGDHGGIIGDWMPPSPSPRSLFAAMLGDETGSRSGHESAKYDNSGFTFPGLDRPIGPAHGDGNQVTKTGSRAGLVERMAARTGHNAPRLNTDIVKPAYNAQNQQTQSPYLTVSPGLSPSLFLDSPVFLSNSLVQPSPTTGKFQFASNGNSIDNNNNNMSKDNFFEDSNKMSFAFKPFLDSASIPRDSDSVNLLFMSAQSFQTNEALIQPEKPFQPQKIEPDQKCSNFTENKKLPLQMVPFEALNGSSDQNHEEQHHDDIDPDQKINTDDGYNWRKYGQKQVKGSEYPRSYYKCTHPNCPVKKKVERSFEGHITEIIYKGAHSHAKVVSNRRLGIGSSSDVSGNWGQESNFEVTSSAVVVKGQNGQFESGDAVNVSSTFSNDEEDDRVTHGSVSVGYDGEGDESESKRRKVEAYAADVSGATRTIREPRVVVQTTSDVDILDDGYRWRKYGQKVVKGNPNPRSYYKCTSTGCTVRKHVERASHDLRSVITTYEGKHNHDVPAARNSSHNNNNTIQPQGQMPRGQTAMPRFERPPYGYGYPMSQQGAGGVAMANQGNTPGFPVHRYLNQSQQMNMMVPKGEPPVGDPASGAVAYHQMMNRLPLGHEM